MKKITLFVILIYGFSNSQIQEINGSINMTGVVEFTGSIEVPDATSSTQAVNLGQLDAKSVRYPMTNIASGGVITASTPFEILLFSSCPPYAEPFIGWDITWVDGNDFKSIKTEYVSDSGTPLRLSKRLGCLSVVGESLNGFTIPTTAILELRY